MASEEKFIPHQGVADEGGDGHQHEQQTEWVQQLRSRAGNMVIMALGSNACSRSRVKPMVSTLTMAPARLSLTISRPNTAASRTLAVPSSLDRAICPFPGLLQSFARGLFGTFLIGISHADPAQVEAIRYQTRLSTVVQ